MKTHQQIVERIENLKEQLEFNKQCLDSDTDTEAHQFYIQERVRLLSRIEELRWTLSN